MSEFRALCAECGGRVEPLSGPGRTALYRRGLRLPIPDGLAIPTCTRCGETYVDAALEPKLGVALEAAYLAWQSAHLAVLVGKLVDRHSTTQREIAGICDITPSHLTHVLKGKSCASVTLVRLLEAFVVCASEFQRHVGGEPFDAQGALRAVYEKRAPAAGFQDRPGTWTMAALAPNVRPPVANDVAA